jgi:hypothetical protein
MPSLVFSSPLVGTLLFLAMTTCPDITFAVSVLCRFISNPGWSHWLAAKHLLCYLQGTKDAKLVYRRDAFDSDSAFATFCDADHAGNPDNMRSTGGYLITIGGAAVAWQSKLQSIAAQSTSTDDLYTAIPTLLFRLHVSLRRLQLGTSTPSAEMHLSRSRKPLLPRRYFIISIPIYPKLWKLTPLIMRLPQYFRMSCQMENSSQQLSTLARSSRQN